MLVILDYLILHLSLLLYNYCENVEREIYATRPLRDHIGMRVNAIFGVRYTINIFNYNIHNKYFESLIHEELFNLAGAFNHIK